MGNFPMENREGMMVAEDPWESHLKHCPMGNELEKAKQGD